MTEHYEGDMPETMTALKEGIVMMRDHSPGSWEAWANFSDTALEPVALSRKTKELVALGMSITAQSKYCVGVHVQRSLDSGATDEEIIDVCNVAMVMGGMPAMSYVAEVHKAVQLYREKQERVC